MVKQFDARPHNAEKQSNADDTLISQREAAEQAGITKHQPVSPEPGGGLFAFPWLCASF